MGLLENMVPWSMARAATSFTPRHLCSNYSRVIHTTFTGTQYPR